MIDLRQQFALPTVLLRSKCLQHFRESQFVFIADSHGRSIFPIRLDLRWSLLKQLFPKSRKPHSVRSKV